MYEKGQGVPRDYVNDDYADPAAAIIAGAVERLATGAAKATEKHENQYMSRIVPQRRDAGQCRPPNNGRAT
jgi:hypothetical protein